MYLIFTFFQTKKKGSHKRRVYQLIFTLWLFFFFGKALEMYRTAIECSCLWNKKKCEPFFPPFSRLSKCTEQPSAKRVTQKKSVWVEKKLSYKRRVSKPILCNLDTLLLCDSSFGSHKRVTLLLGHINEESHKRDDILQKRFCFVCFVWLFFWVTQTKSVWVEKKRSHRRRVCKPFLQSGIDTLLLCDSFVCLFCVTLLCDSKKKGHTKEECVCPLLSRTSGLDTMGWLGLEGSLT